MYEDIIIETVKLNKDNDYIHTFKSLPVHEKEYTIKEVNIPTDYVSKITSNENNFIITNSLDLKSDVMDLTFEKIWNDKDNKYGKRPDKIEVILLKDKSEFARIELNKDDNWKNELKNIPIGEYSIKEINVPKGYTSVISNGGIVDQDNTSITITNTYQDDINTNHKGELPDGGQGLLYLGGLLLALAGVGLVIRKYLNSKEK